jgi:hypothetical protein
LLMWHILVSASSMSGAFGGLLASGLLKIPQIKGLWVVFSATNIPTLDTHLKIDHMDNGATFVRIHRHFLPFSDIENDPA